MSAVSRCLFAAHALVSYVAASGGRRLQLTGLNTCKEGTNCQAAGITSDRGVCVLTGSGTACWDVCDMAHGTTDFKVSPVPESSNNTQLQMLVDQIRDGKNLHVSCCTNPPCQTASGSMDWCPPGARCGGNQAVASANVTGLGSTVSAHARSLPPNSGICVLDENGPQGRRCLDMCDYDNTESDYGMGGTDSWTTVQAVRGGSDGLYTCSHFSVWPILLGIVVCCCCSIIGGVLYMRFCRDRFAKPAKRGVTPAPVPRDFEVYQEANQPEPMIEERGLEAPMPPVQAEPPQDLGPPPVAAAPVMESQPPAPVASSWQGRIPGMDEPLLTVPGVQPVYTPQTQAQVADPALIAQAQPFMSVPSQPPIQGYGVRPMTVLPSYSSQPAMGGAFATQPQLASQPGSMQIAPQLIYR